VWRVLHDAGLLERWNGKPSKKGTGFEQPLRPHAHWHKEAPGMASGISAWEHSYSIKYSFAIIYTNSDTFQRNTSGFRRRIYFSWHNHCTYLLVGMAGWTK